MGLFSKKPPCASCGGKVGFFLPKKIEGEYICGTCYGKIDMEPEKRKKLTMQGFREYLAFYDQNQVLKSRFVISERVDFGLMDTKIIFDYQSKLFCMSKNPDKTIFEGHQLKSFIIKEDNAPLFEGSAEGIKRYTSSVPDRIMALAPRVDEYNRKRKLAQATDKNGSTQVQPFNIPEPFKAFNVELHLDHPYWTVIKCDMNGPRFSKDRPDINDYIRLYELNIADMEKLANAFRTVAFPDAQLISAK